MQTSDQLHRLLNTGYHYLIPIDNWLFFVFVFVVVFLLVQIRDGGLERSA